MNSSRIHAPRTALRRSISLRRRAACALGLATVLAAGLVATPADAGPAFDARDRSPVTYTSEAATATRDIWRTLAETHDFDVVFAPKMRDLEVDFDISDATLGDVLDRLALAGSHFWLPLDGRTVLVANDTPQARREYEPQAMQTFRLENIRVADAMTALRSIYGLKHVTVDETRRTLTVRDFAGKVALARDLISRLDVPEDEVTVGLQLVSVPEAVWRARDAESLDRLL
ncbi:MAG: secretin N-terminal domain-containing protein, partial [Acidobacteriota bacterium]